MKYLFYLCGRGFCATQHEFQSQIMAAIREKFSELKVSDHGDSGKEAQLDAEDSKDTHIQFDEEHLPVYDEDQRSKLVPKITISENNSEVFCVRFSPDGHYLAAGCNEGGIRIFNTFTGALAYNLQVGSSVALPTTAIKFRPPDGTSSRTKNVFITAVRITERFSTGI